MKKIILVLICSVMSLSAYARITASKDLTKVSFSSPAEYRSFVSKLNNTFLLTKTECNAAYCAEAYNQCVVTNLEAIKKENPDVVIEGNADVQFEITSYCTLLTGLSYSICKEDMTNDQATTFLANYNKAKEMLLEEATKKNKKAKK